jgi:hypothetical protein
MKAMGERSIASLVTLVLDVCWYLGAISLGLLALLLVFSLFPGSLGGNLQMSLPVAFNVDSHAYTVTSSSLETDDAHMEKVRAYLRFPIQKGRFLSINVAIIIVVFSFGLWVLTQLRQVFRTLRDGRPFVSANATRLRWIGFAVILGELVRAGMVWFWSYYTSMHFRADGVHFVAMADLNTVAIVHGLVILVIAEVFREGARLEEDRSLTI